VDLIRGLAAIAPDRVKFIVFGSKAEPVSELVDIFQNHQDWQYRQIKPWRFKGSTYMHQLRYAAIIATHRLDIFHALHSFIPFFKSCRVVFTQYDLMWELFPEYSAIIGSRDYKQLRWGVQHRVDQIISISDSTANDTVRLWQIPLERISVIRNCVDPVKFNHTNATSFSPLVQSIQTDTGQTLLSVFNLEPRKNLEALLQALPMVLAQYPNLRLFLFGKAAWTMERQQKFTALLKELNIEDRVICTGFVEDHELALLYRYATIFIFPSLYEGFGLPILEAMAQGACVVARAASSMAEIVGEAGVLVEPCDRDHLATAIGNLLENQALRASLSTLAKARAAEFTVTKMATNTLKVYLA